MAIRQVAPNLQCTPVTLFNLLGASVICSFSSARLNRLVSLNCLTLEAQHSTECVLATFETVVRCMGCGGTCGPCLLCFVLASAVLLAARPSLGSFVYGWPDLVWTWETLIHGLSPLSPLCPTPDNPGLCLGSPCSSRWGVLAGVAFVAAQKEIWPSLVVEPDPVKGLHVFTGIGAPVSHPP